MSCSSCREALGLLMVLVVFIAACNIGCFRISFVHVEAIVPRDTGSCRYGEIAHAFVFAFEVMDPEGVGGEKTVIAYVPPSGVAGVAGVIENCDAHSSALDGAEVIDPLGSLAPRRVASDAFAIHDLSCRDFTFETHRGR